MQLELESTRIAYARRTPSLGSGLDGRAGIAHLAALIRTDVVAAWIRQRRAC